MEGEIAEIAEIVKNMPMRLKLVAVVVVHVVVVCSGLVVVC